MDVAITRFVRFENEGTLKAFCDVALGGVLLIKGIRVVEGRHGPFVSMPRQQSRTGKWYDSIVPLTKEVKARIHQTVLGAYEAYGAEGSIVTTRRTQEVYEDEQP